MAKCHCNFIYEHILFVSPLRSTKMHAGTLVVIYDQLLLQFKLLLLYNH